MSMTTNDNWLSPSWNKTWDCWNDDWLSKDGSTKDVADRAVRALPHLLEVELLDPRLVGRDRRALDADLVLEDSLGSFDCHFVVGLGSYGGSGERRRREGVPVLKRQAENTKTK